MNATAMIASYLTKAGLLIGLLAISMIVHRPTAAELNQVDPALGRWSAPELLATSAGVPVMQATNASTILIYNQAVDPIGNSNPAYRTLSGSNSGWSEAAFIHSDQQKDFKQVAARFDTDGQAHASWRSDTAVLYAAQSQWATNQFSIVIEDDNKIIEDLDMVIANDNIVHIVMAIQDETNFNRYNIYHSYLDGQTWNTKELLEDTDQRLITTRMAVDSDGHIHVVWEERTSLNPGNYQINYMKGSRQGSDYTWSATESISTGVSRARRPAILADGNDLHVTFTKHVSNSEQTIYYAYRPATTGNWTAPVDITNNSPLAVSLVAGVMASSLAFCQDSLHVFYFGGLQANSNEQIFGQRYQFGAWQSREMITDNSVRRIRPTAVCHNNRLLLAYEQIITPGTNHAIYVVAAYEQVHLPLIIKN
jgi:hypothetical protein